MVVIAWALKSERGNCRTPFSALDSCGHVFSDRAIGEMKDGRCMECGMAFEKTDIVHLNSDSASQKSEMEENLKKTSKRSHIKGTSSSKRKATAPLKRKGESLHKQPKQTLDP